MDTGDRVRRLFLQLTEQRIIGNSPLYEASEHELHGAGQSITCGRQS